MGARVHQEPWVFLLLANVLMLFVGCFLEPTAAITILVPLLLPIARQLGVDPVHFGLVMVLNLMIGLLHPPMGMVLFVLARVAKLSVERTTMAILPWLVPLLGSLVVLPTSPPFRSGCRAWQAWATDSKGLRDMSQRLAGKNAFVTAAGQGIGRATAEAFAREGAHVIATDIDERLLQGLAGCSTQRLDMADGAAIAAAIAAAGPLDVLFNAAGYVHAGTVLDCDEAAWDFSFDLNVRSMYRSIRAVLPGMLQRGGGSIINVASVASVEPEGHAGPLRLRRQQGGGDRPHQVGCGRLRDARHPLQRDLSRAPSSLLPCAERIEAQAQATGQTLEQVRAAFIARQPMGRVAAPKRSPRWRSIWRATSRRSPPARPDLRRRPHELTTSTRLRHRPGPRSRRHGAKATGFSTLNPRRPE